MILINYFVKNTITQHKYTQYRCWYSLITTNNMSIYNRLDKEHVITRLALKRGGIFSVIKVDMLFTPTNEIKDYLVQLTQ